MNRFVYAVIGAALVPAIASTQPALRPQPSSRATSEVVLTYPQGQEPANARPMSIRLDYGVPHLRGRPLHTDSLVPYNTVWRTGANATTTLTTDVDLILGGAEIPAGAYAVFTLPSPQGWKLIIQKNTGQLVVDVVTANDVARLDLRRTTLPQPLESLSMWLIPSNAPGVGRGEWRIAWGTVQLSVDWTVK